MDLLWPALRVVGISLLSATRRIGPTVSLMVGRHLVHKEQEWTDHTPELQDFPRVLW